MVEVDRVAAAFAAAPRADFLPPALRGRASYDGPLPLGNGQTSSQPRTVEAMLRLLAVRPGDRVLDVGAGSGWTTALLGHLCGADGEVLGLEVDPLLAAWGAANVRRAAPSWCQVARADPDRLGRVLGEGEDSAGRRWDRVLVSAMARSLPYALVDRLADSGRMVVPVAGRMTLVVRRDGEVTVTRHGAYRFVPLIGG